MYLYIRDYEELEKDLVKKTNLEILDLFSDREKNKEELVLRNYRFILSIIHKSSIKYSLWEDAFSDGLLGLLGAIEKFDINKNVEFLSFASYKIKLAMYRGIQESEAIAFPEYFYYTLRHVRKSLLENPKADILNLVTNYLDKFGCKDGNPDRVTKDIKFYLTVNHCSDVLKNDEGNSYDILLSESFEDESLSRVNLECLIKDITSIVGEEKKDLIVMRLYGETYKDISEKMGYSSQRVHQKYTKAIKDISKNEVFNNKYNPNI